MKYNHSFSLIKKTPSMRLYYADKKYIRLDFFQHMMRVAIYSDEKMFPTFSICPGTSKMKECGRDRLSVDGLEVIEQKEDNVFFIDDIRIEANLRNFQLSYTKNGLPLFKDRDILSYNIEGEMGKGSNHYLSREKDEHIYGLGDKTGNVNKNGMHFSFETFDAMGFDALHSDPLYKQIPFYICKNKVGSYGIFYDTYSNGYVDFGREHNNYYPPYKYVHFEEENLVYYVLFGNVEEIIQRFTYLTGKSFLPPKWSFQYCGSTMAYTDSNHPLDSFHEFERKCKEYEIDCGGFYLSSGYTQIGDKRCVFHWNKEKFPDPKAFADEFLSKGIHFLPNIKPAFLTTHPFYEEIKKNGWFLHYRDGTPYVFPFWGGMGSYLDFTNKEAYDFWTKCVKESLVDLGYCSIWNDNNEYDIHDEDVYCAGFGTPLPAKRIRPLFSLLMMMASNAAVDPAKRHMAVTRSAPMGFQRIGETWTGDNQTSFADFRGNHKMAMTASLTGFTFIGQDIGGFAGEKPSKELFLRWIAYGVLTPRFTLHSWNADGSSTMPWLYEEAKDQVMKIFALRKKLLPYIYSSAMDAVENYLPMLLPIFLYDEDYDEESDFYFFGKSILVCPIFDEGKNEIDVLLPKGEFYYPGTDKIFHGGRIKNMPGDLPSYFIKEGSMVPVIEKTETIFEIYPLEEGGFEYRFYEDDSTLENPYRPIKVRCKEDTIHVSGIHENEKVSLYDKMNRRLIRE